MPDATKTIKSRGTVTIDVEHCKGCDLCIPACPPGVLAMSTNASRAAPVRSSAADSARTVSTWGRRRSPRSSALTA